MDFGGFLVRKMREMGVLEVKMVFFECKLGVFEVKMGENWVFLM
jgi:hypothetical protein